MAKVAMFLVTALIPIAAFADQTILLRDGARFTGRLVRADENVVVMRDENGRQREFEVRRIQSIEFDRLDSNTRGRLDRPDGNNTYPPDRPSPDRAYPDRANADRRDSDRDRGSSYMTLPTGTEISVRTNEAINAQSGSDGRMFSAQIDRDVLDSNNHLVIPRGSEAQLTIRNTGDRQVSLDLASVTLNGRRYTVDTADVTQQADRKDGVGANKRTGEYVGGGAVLGTLLGAIAGGGKGAAIGALAGGAAGAGAQVLTRGSQVKVPSETVLNFRLDNSLTLNPGR